MNCLRFAQVSKVTRSRSWGARPPGVVVYNRNGEPAGVETPGYETPAIKPASTIGLGYRPGTALRYRALHSGIARIGHYTQAGHCTQV